MTPGKKTLALFLTASALVGGAAIVDATRSGPPAQRPARSETWCQAVQRAVEPFVDGMDIAEAADFLERYQGNEPCILPAFRELVADAPPGRDLSRFIYRVHELFPDGLDQVCRRLDGGSPPSDPSRTCRTIRREVAHMTGRDVEPWGIRWRSPAAGYACGRQRVSFGRLEAEVVCPGFAADRAGFRPGDVVLEINGEVGPRAQMHEFWMHDEAELMLGRQGRRVRLHMSR